MDKIILAVLIVYAFYRLYRWTEKHTYHDPADGTTYHYENGMLAIDEYIDEVDEHSQLNLDVDKALKQIRLKNKLSKIEEEKEKHSAPFIPISVEDYLLLRRMKGYDE
jgi:hypothetical protein